MAFAKFFLKRSLQGLLVIWGVVTVVFLLRHLTPGNPVNTLLPPDAGAEERARLAENLGLNDPIHVQYANYLLDVAMLDFGESWRTSRPVIEVILVRIPATLELAFAATVVSIIIAIPLGVISARRRHEPSDYAATMFSLVGISTPNFWLGVMLIIFVSVQVGFVPTGGRGPSLAEALFNLTQGQLFDDGILDWLRHITLPAIALGTYFTALLTRLTRSGMLDEIGKTYVKASRAKGIPETLVLYKHVLRNTLIPIVTVLGLQLGTLIGGAVITEEVFAWPGLGRFFILSIGQRDWAVIQGIIIVIGIGFVIVNIIVDTLYTYLNPKVDLE